MEKFIQNLREMLEVDEKDIKLTDHFREYEEWNSLAYLSLIAMMDEEYNVQIEGSEFKKLITIHDLINAINAKK